MNVLESIADWRTYRATRSAPGFVPTMGALHEGHLALLERSVADHEWTAVSIFVNPTQFDNADDLRRYPRSLREDLGLLEEYGVDAVLLPPSDQLYPDGYRYRVTETDFSNRLCGAHRPGHFDGVLTVVMKLLNLVRPAAAYFGEKDYQQLRLVRGLVEAFFLDTRIVGVPTVREADGLALSSRNLRLDPAQRRIAPELRRVLSEAPNAATARRQLEQSGFAVDYVEELDGRRLAAARLGDVRLIDNVPLG